MSIVYFGERHAQIDKFTIAESLFAKSMIDTERWQVRYLILDIFVTFVERCNRFPSILRLKRYESMVWCKNSILLGVYDANFIHYCIFIHKRP